MKRNLSVSGLLTLAVSLSLQATTLTYDDRAEWSAQVINLTNFDGGSLSPGQFQSYGTTSGLIVSGLQIIGMMNTGGNPWYDLLQISAGPTQTYYNWNSGTIIRSGDKTSANTVTVRLNFAAPVSAFGFNYGGGGGDVGLTITPGGMSAINVQALARPNFQFFGVTSDSQTFSTVDIAVNNVDRYLVIDDIARGTYSAPEPPPPPVETPEAGTLLHLALGSGLMVFARHRFGGER